MKTLGNLPKLLMALFCSGLDVFLLRGKTFRRGTRKKFLKRKKVAHIFVEKVCLNCTKPLHVGTIKVQP